MEGFITWAAPILSALVICAGQLVLNRRFKQADEKRDEARKETDEARRREDEWRSSIDARLDAQDAKIDDLLASQCSQLRSDIVHKAHRYLDDMGCASVEEKRSLYAEYEDYGLLCEKAGVRNHLIDRLVERIVDLPERDL